MGAACSQEGEYLDISVGCDMVIDRRVEWVGYRVATIRWVILEHGVLDECERVSKWQNSNMCLVFSG